jgi:hypothetical protein
MASGPQTEIPAEDLCGTWCELGRPFGGVPLAQGRFSVKFIRSAESVFFLLSRFTPRRKALLLETSGTNIPTLFIN